jgi:hypothetical protein
MSIRPICWRAAGGRLVAAVLAAIVSSACSPTQQASQSTTAEPLLSSASQALSFEPTATIQDLMQDEIDPAADAVWGSVGSITTRAGTEEKRPQTDEQWKALRRNAIVLIEATNLLAMKGRQVAAVDFPSDGPGVLSSREIQEQLARDPAEFQAFTQSLRETAKRVLAAIDAKDSTRLLTVGEEMDGVCEACHLSNWYPHEVIPTLPDNPQPGA